MSLTHEGTTKTAVILAGSEGIGFASAAKLAAAGKRVVLFSRSQTKLDAAVARLNESGHDAVTCAGDIAREADLERLFALVDERFGGTDILVNNTGGPPPGSALDLTNEQWELALRDLTLPLLGAIRRVVPRMKQQRWGRIVTIASLAVKMPLDDLDLSNYARAGLAAVHKTLARKLAPEGITVNVVLPGSIMTERSRRLIEGRAAKQGITFEQALGTSIAKIPMGRLGRPEEVGEVVSFLASDGAGYVSGNFIQVDGAMFPGMS
jgi:3-oxoacyl-[acyl-carrier protein] reductase